MPNSNKKEKKMTEYKSIFEDAFEDYPQDPDSIKAAMVKEGVPFQSVTRVFNQLMIETGRHLSKKDRELFINKIIKRGIKTEKGFNSRVDEFMRKITFTTERSAGASIRYFCKDNDIEVYQRPVRNSEPRVSFTKQFCDFVLLYPDHDESQIMDFLMDENRATYVKRNANNFMEIWRMAQCLRK